MKERKGECPQCGGLTKEFLVTDPWLIGVLGKKDKTWLALICEKCRRQEELERRKKKRAQHLEQELERAGVPPVLREKSFGNFVIKGKNSRKKRVIVERLKVIASRFDEVKERPIFLTFLGGTGTGKTHLAAAFIRALLLRGFRCYYRPWLEYIEDRRIALRQDNALASLRAKFAVANLIILDDIASVAGKPWQVDELYRIVDLCCGHGKALVLISEKPISEIHFNDPAANWAMQRIMSRLNREPLNEVLLFDWPPYHVVKGGS